MAKVSRQDKEILHNNSGAYVSQLVSLDSYKRLLAYILSANEFKSRIPRTGV